MENDGLRLTASARDKCRGDATPRKRRLQFGIGTLLILTAIFSLWLGRRVNRANSQRRAEEVFQKLGFQINYDYQRAPNRRGAIGYSHLVEVPGPKWIREQIGDHYFRSVEMVIPDRLSGTVTDLHFANVASFPDLRVLHLRNTAVTDAALVHLSALRELRNLTIVGKVSDGGLRHMSGLSNLEALDLGNNQIGGAGLVNLSNLPKLKQLFLHDNPISDEGLSHIGEISSLEMLSLSNSSVTDDGLDHLTTLTGLVHLGLSRTNVTDSGLAHLAKLTSLRTLELNGTEVTEEGRSLLQQTLPACKIIPRPR